MSKDIWKQHTEGLAEVVKQLEEENKQLISNWGGLYDKLCGYHEALEAGEQYELANLVGTILEDMKEIRKPTDF